MAQRSINAGEDPTSFLQNGSWVVDHFSAAGSQIMTDFFDSHVVPDPDDKALLTKVGKYGESAAQYSRILLKSQIANFLIIHVLAWEDSMEMNAGVWWTSGFEEKFRDSLGYDIWTCLPFLLIQDNSWAQQIIPYGEEFRSVNNTHSDKCVDDYRLVLQQGYEEYVKAHVTWARKGGLEYSNQPAYNLPLSAVNSVLLLDGPEVEPFGFNDHIDSYKFFSGPGHLAGNPVLSSECGAAPSLSYTQKLGELLRSVHRGLAGGVSMNVFHGFPYSGPFANTTWPGTTIFAYRFTEMWGPRQPAWKLISPFLAYVSRNQFILQSGIPKVDLAFYAYGVPYKNSDGYESNNLYRFGYTYDYLGPASLESGAAIVANGLLAADGPAYKAVVFSNQTKITQAAAAKLHEFARRGLPIIFVGNLTMAGVGMNASASVEVAAMLSNLTSANFPNVRQIPSADGLVATLQSLNIKPRAALPSDGSTTEWYSFWRSLPEGEVAWLYNGETEGKARNTVEFVFSGVQGLVPYSLNAWTGNISAVLQYRINDDSIAMPVTLGPEESTLIFFQKEKSPAHPIPVVESLIGSVAGLSTRIGVDGSSGLVALVKNGPGEIVFSNGTSIQLNGSAPPESELEYWDVMVEDWHRTQNLTDIRTAITVHKYSKTALLSWLHLDPANLTNVSGLGHYSTSFTAPSAASERALGALLHLAPQGDSFTININDVVLPSTSYIGDTVMDITNHVNWSTETSPGTNLLQIDVATTLFNRLRSETNQTWSMGTAPDDQLYSARAYENHGLKGPVCIEWVELFDIA
ncbi:hypothetical protein SLS63_013491 [Diaporthe eres]|uniref:Secreted protein n=1 Tax=Diaporthe eres TaxID=83184 RepID=A0ABR1NND9_DIAER